MLQFYASVQSKDWFSFPRRLRHCLQNRFSCVQNRFQSGDASAVVCHLVNTGQRDSKRRSKRSQLGNGQRILPGKSKCPQKPQKAYSCNQFAPDTKRKTDRKRGTGLSGIRPQPFCVSTLLTSADPQPLDPGNQPVHKAAVFFGTGHLPPEQPGFLQHTDQNQGKSREKTHHCRGCKLRRDEEDRYDTDK